MSCHTAKIETIETIVHRGNMVEAKIETIPYVETCEIHDMIVRVESLPCEYRRMTLAFLGSEKVSYSHERAPSPSKKYFLIQFMEVPINATASMKTTQGVYSCRLTVAFFVASLPFVMLHSDAPGTHNCDKNNE